MDTQTIIICLLSSTLAATVVASIKELILWKLNRNAKIEDDNQECQEAETVKLLEEYRKALDKAVTSMKALEKKVDLSLENDKIILKDKIKYLVIKYSEFGEITFEEKQAINHMWHIYHYDLEGNGDLDDYMAMLEEIKVVQHHTIPRGGIYA